MENTSLKALPLGTSGESGSRTNHSSLQESHWNVVWIRDSFTEYVKEISIISLPSHRRRDRKSTTPLELSQLRALNGQLLWLGLQCLPQLLAPPSLLMGQTPRATVGTIYEVNKLVRKATAWAKNITQNPCSSLSCCGYAHRCWMDHSARRHVTRWRAVLHCKLPVVAKQRIKHV